jgi:hypothetical protein
VQALRRRVTLGTLGVFAVAFGTFLVLCGYARPFMRRSVDGGLTVAYVWLLALPLLVWVYLRVAERLSAMAQQMLVGTGPARGLENAEPRTSERPPGGDSL